ncbi:acetyltransferase [Metabacillus dongyingensis]|uniref:acetyltransferase n=1 Tax=Metabacillus dongyingensis TaxID=2874282 RepID=UPI001CC16205|nr:acetyltransferase [Metabacillus dongyingensis]UAL50267.1 acetyltransferase [Metabacillus dongyingensis]
MNIVIIGEGGHSKVVKDIILSIGKFNILAFLDDKYDQMLISDHIFYGPISAYKYLIKNYMDIKFIIAIGNNEIRKKITTQLDVDDDFYTSFIHPSAIVSSSVKLGIGTVVMANAVINAESNIGDHVIINTGAIIEHENQIGKFSHVSPRGTLTGNVKIGEGVHIGAGATIIPNVFIGEWSVIGAGATVVKSIPSYKTAIGVPAKY